VTRHLSPPDPDGRVTALDDCADPVAAFLAAHSKGGLISIRTSGTTGHPRRVIRTTASWVDSFPAVAELIGLQASSRAWIPGPLTATMNLYAAALVTYYGARLVPERDSATHAFLTPAGLTTLLEQTAPRDLCIVAAGDRLRPELADQAEGRGWRVSHYYGAAQLSFVAWGRDATRLRPFPKVKVQVRGGSQLWVSSPWLCERELVPVGMQPSLAVEVDSENGRRWASVGDRGELRPDGRLLVAGRMDVILVGGATVLISEVEAALREAAEGEVFVVAMPHPRLGSTIAAVFTKPTDLPRLQARARTVLDRQQQPVRWLQLPTIPVTPAGKVDRNALAALATERIRAAGPSHPPPNLGSAAEYSAADPRFASGSHGRTAVSEGET
jgi:long-chain acyl-CoA synthetase